MSRHQLSIPAQTTMSQRLPDDFIEKLENFRSYVSTAIDEHVVCADHLINMDEMPLTFDIPTSRSIEEKGVKTVNIRTTGHEQSRFTVVLACSASGAKLPPMIIFKRKTKPKDAFPPNVIIKYNTMGWMDEEMIDWLQ